jgi:hypothetical protein
MKKIITLSILFTVFTLTAYAQESKPKVTYQVGTAKVTVWEAEKDGKYGKYIDKDFKVEKIYKKDGEWKSTNSFDLNELLQLRAAIDKAISEEGVKIKEGEEKN